MREADWNLMYRELNERLWGGRLPEYAVKLWSRKGMGAEDDNDLGYADGSCDRRAREIRLLRGMPAERTRRTLLHEMCHVAAGYGHGEKFVRQLRRLARAGEAWAATEARPQVSRSKDGMATLVATPKGLKLKVKFPSGVGKREAEMRTLAYQVEMMEAERGRAVDPYERAELDVALARARDVIRRLLATAKAKAK
jgi:hypothetical protein